MIVCILFFLSKKMDRVAFVEEEKKTEYDRLKKEVEELRFAVENLGRSGHPLDKLSTYPSLGQLNLLCLHKNDTIWSTSSRC